MNAQLIKIDFTTPMAINLDDKVNLRAIHEELKRREGVKPHSKFAEWVKNKLRRYTENTDYFRSSEKSDNSPDRIQYIASVQVAMEIVANGHGDPGHDMRRFMSSCVRKVVESSIHQGMPIPPLLEQAEMLLAGWKQEQTLRIAAESERDLYQDSLVKLDDYVKNKPVTAVGEHGIPSHAIIKEYPEVVGMMYDDFKQNLYWSKKYSAYPEHSKVSVWLLCFGKIPALKRKLPRSKSYINLFSRADIEGFLARRQQSDEV